MPDSAWKKAERRIAKKLGGTRTPLSGAASKHGTSSDVLGIPEYVEVKRRKNSRLLAELTQRTGPARRQGRTPAILCERNKPDLDGVSVSYLALWLEDYLEHRGRFPARDWILEHDGFKLAHFVTRAGPTHARTVMDAIAQAQREPKHAGSQSVLVCIQGHNRNKVLALANLIPPRHHKGDL